MISELIGAKLRVVRGNLRSTQEGRSRAVLFISLSTIFTVGLYRSALWLVNESLAIQPIGELLVQKLISVAFIIFLGILTFSNIVTVFTTFYLADDMDFLMGQPIPPDALFTARYLESLTQSSWVIVLFGLPAFIGLGVGMQADWSYYAMLLGVLLPFVAIPTGLATLIALAVSNMLVATRMRDAAMFMGLAVFVILFTMIRWMQPEKLLNPESFDSLGQMITLLSTPKRSYLPSDWVTNILIPLLFRERSPDPWALALLGSTPLSLYFISAWAHRRYFMRGFSRVQEGRHGDGIMTSLRDWLLRRSTERGGGASARLEAMAQSPADASFGPMAQLTRKDRLIFTRDASQWSNLLVIVALMIIYLVNYKYFEIASEAKFFGEIGLYYFNLAVCGFVVVALSGRFLFPGVSVEGRSFWLLMQAPISLEKMLMGKWFGGMAPVLFVGQLMIWASNLLVRPDLYWSITGALLILMLTTCIAGIAVGLGAVYPQFYNPNASAIAASFGALIFMILSIIIVLMSIVSSYRFFLGLSRAFIGEGLMYVGVNEWLGLFIGVAIPVCASAGAILLGARSLRRRL